MLKLEGADATDATDATDAAVAATNGCALQLCYQQSQSVRQARLQAVFGAPGPVPVTLVLTRH
jgi:hypothetical protein